MEHISHWLNTTESGTNHPIYEPPLGLLFHCHFKIIYCFFSLLFLFPGFREYMFKEWMGHTNLSSINYQYQWLSMFYFQGNCAFN